MKLLNFYRNGTINLGVKTEWGILCLSDALLNRSKDCQIPKTMEQVLLGGKEALSKLEKFTREMIASKEEVFLDEQELNFAPSIPNPGKIICVGLNYRKHALESNLPVPEIPILFNKYSNSITANGVNVTLPPNAKKVDYEAELVIVIKRSAKNISVENVSDYIFGYSIANDLSARDLQFATSQWLLGKNCDGFCPLGPYLVTEDEIENPNSLGIRTYVNGKIVQNSNTADMIFNCKEIVSFISKHFTLEPGDIILTGTPEGVIMGRKKTEQEWLKEGDVVTIEIDSIGSLSNKMSY